MSFSYSDYERLAALERRIQDLEAQVQLLHDLVGQRTGLSGTAPHPSPETLYDVLLVGYPGHQKISVIKVIRELTGLGLKEAKDLAESVPCVILRVGDEQTVRTLQRQLEAVGAVLELQPR